MDNSPVVKMLRKTFIMKSMSKSLHRGASRKVSTHVVSTVKPFTSIPRPFQLPVLGNWYLYKLGYYNFSKYHEVLKHLYEKYGPVVYEKIGFHEPVIHIFEVEDVETVYKNENKMPTNFPLNKFLKVYREEEQMCPGLGQTNGEEWYRLRNGIRDLMMKTQSVKRFTPLIETVTDDLVVAMYNTQDKVGEIRHLNYLLGQYFLEVAGRIVTGKSLGYLNGSNVNLAKKIIDANNIVFELGAALKFSLPFYRYLKVPKYSKLFENEHFVHSILHKIIDEAITELEKDRESEHYQNTEKRIFLEELLKQSHLRRDEMIVLTSSLFVDSLSTVLPVLVSNFFALATNEDVQNKAYEEICEITNNKDVISDETLRELTYLKAVVKETFRMYPNGVENARINQTPLVLSNYEIPTGTHLSLNLLVHSRSEKYFTKPNTFYPERWIKSSSEAANVSPYLLLPFGIRARPCSGQKFAERYLYMSLCKILKAFRLSYPVDGPPIDFVFKNLIFPDKYLPIRFIPRK